MTQNTMEIIAYLIVEQRDNATMTSWEAERSYTNWLEKGSCRKTVRMVLKGKTIGTTSSLLPNIYL